MSFGGMTFISWVPGCPVARDVTIEIFYLQAREVDHTTNTDDHNDRYYDGYGAYTLITHSTLK